jgi:hypothetical protein
MKVASMSVTAVMSSTTYLIGSSPAGCAARASISVSRMYSL